MSFPRCVCGYAAKRTKRVNLLKGVFFPTHVTNLAHTLILPSTMGLDSFLPKVSVASRPEECLGILNCPISITQKKNLAKGENTRVREIMFQRLMHESVTFLLYAVQVKVWDISCPPPFRFTEVSHLMHERCRKRVLRA
jgi:hypothetical protein